MFSSPKTLKEQVDLIADSLLAFPHEAEVTLTLPINDDVPDEFVEVDSSIENETLSFEKVISAKDGKVTKKITLVMPD